MLPRPPATDPSLLYRYRDAVCVTDYLSRIRIWEDGGVVVALATFETDLGDA